MIGLAVGATAGLGLIVFMIYKEVNRRRSQRMYLEAGPPARLSNSTDGPALLLLESLDARGRLLLHGTETRGYNG